MQSTYTKSGFLRCICGVLLCAALCGCGHTVRKAHTPSMHLAVLNFSIPDEWIEKDRKGWWFGSRDIYRNKNAGEMVAERLAAALQDVNGFQVYPIEKYRDSVIQQNPATIQNPQGKSKSQHDGSMHQQFLQKVGTELGVEKIVTGEILDIHTSHHRVFHWWSSVVEVRIALIDVGTGLVEWQETFKKRKMLTSQIGAMNVTAKKIARKLAKDYF